MGFWKDVNITLKESNYTKSLEQAIQETVKYYEKYKKLK